MWHVLIQKQARVTHPNLPDVLDFLRQAGRLSANLQMMHVIMYSTPAWPQSLCQLVLQLCIKGDRLNNPTLGARDNVLCAAAELRLHP